MGSIFRLEEMTLAQLFLQSDSAYTCIRELGELVSVCVVVSVCVCDESIYGTYPEMSGQKSE